MSTGRAAFLHEADGKAERKNGAGHRLDRWVARLVALDKPSARLNSAGLGAILPYHRLTNGLRKRNEFGS